MLAGGKGWHWVAGRPKRSDVFGTQEVQRATYSFYIDARLVAALRDVNARSCTKPGEGKPSLSQTVEGVIFWGLYCAQYHREETETPVWTYEEAKEAGLWPVEEGRTPIGEQRHGERYKPDPDQLQSPRTRKRGRPKGSTDSYRRTRRWKVRPK